MAPKLSICMVSLDCRAVMLPCLDSVYASERAPAFEIIIVDNGSRDGGPAEVARRFPDVRVIESGYNAGFTKGTNLAIAASTGEYLLWLNPDTILRPDTLRSLCEFLDGHPKAGIVGPKVTNADGSFQPQCKRGMPTPGASLAYFSKLSRLFPHSRRLGQYLLTYLPVDESNRVTAVSGCCLLARRAVWDQIGALDEDIFSYGEDIDWCVRASERGWEVWYFPGAQLTHLKGQGGAHSKPYRKAWGMHSGMWVFYSKHLKQRYSPLTSGIVWLGIQAGLAAAYARITLTRLFKPAAAGGRSLQSARP